MFLYCFDNFIEHLVIDDGPDYDFRDIVNGIFNNFVKSPLCPFPRQTPDIADCEFPGGYFLKGPTHFLKALKVE